MTPGGMDSASRARLDGWADAAAYADDLAARARAELSLITTSGKAHLDPGEWRPVAYAASAPAAGVTLDGGPLRTCFERNIAYLNEWFAAKKEFREESASLGWEEHLPASSWGRMLGGAAQTLRWGEREDMRRIVDAVVAVVKANQRPDGYCLPYDESLMSGSGNAWLDERRNYDRVCLTRGMAAAAAAGNRDALPVMRRFYDWLYASPYCAGLLAGPFDNGSSHNCVNGHEGGLLMYFSPAGRPEDLVTAERCFVQDFFLEASARKEAFSLSHYPFHVAHSYVLLAYKAWLDHYRATGAAKYLEAARGAWQIVHDHYLHVGGSLAICEHKCGTYPPDSYFLRVDREHHTGETCGSVFWADVNHRLMQLFPEEARYADEVERSVLNCILACQDARGHVRYHSRLVGRKDDPGSKNTCCEVMASPFIGGLPQYLYSVAEDGLYVNLFAPSTIRWRQAGRPVGLRVATGFPFDGRVAMEVSSAGPEAMRLRVRVPGWARGPVEVRVNGAAVAEGEPGRYVTLDRTWTDRDVADFTLPMDLRTVRYSGMDEDPEHGRHALLLGPVLMALVGATDLDVPAADLARRLEPVAGRPLHFGLAGRPGVHYQPYWQIQEEAFTCFPTMR